MKKHIDLIRLSHKKTSFSSHLKSLSFFSAVVLATFVVIYVAAGANTTIGNNISTSGSLTVGGSTTLASATLSGVLNASSTLQVTGATTLYNSLTVAGSSTFATTTIDNGDFTVSSGALFVDETTGGIGIGTTSITTHINISGNPDGDEFILFSYGGSSDTAGLRFQDASSGLELSAIKWNPTDSRLDFYNGSSGNTDDIKLQVTSSGITASGTISVLSTATSTFSGGIESTALNITSSSASSTFANGIQLSSGCFSVGGTCLGGGTGSGTVGTATLAGQVPYYASASDTLTATSTLFISTAGNVGIGTSTINSGNTLQVNGSVSSNFYRAEDFSADYTTSVTNEYSGWAEYNSAGNRTQYAVIEMIRTGSSDGNYDGEIAFGTRVTGSVTAEAMRINKNGKVGIGTSSPSTILTLGGSDPTISVDTSSGDDTKGLFLSGAGDVSSARGAWAALYGAQHATNPDELWLNGGSTSGAVIFSQGGIEYARLNAGGNFGIGTTSPTAKLQINSGTEGIEFDPAVATDQGRILFYDRPNAAFNTGSYDALAHVFRTSGSDKVVITSSGNVGIGTTSPVAQLSVEMGTNPFAFWVGDQGTSSPSFIVDGAGNVGVGTITPGANFGIRKTNAGGNVTALLENLDNTNSASNAHLGIRTAGSGGNPQILMTVSGATDWIFGVDNSDSDKFKFGPTNALSSASALTLTTSGNVGIGTTSPGTLLSLHSGSDYINFGVTSTSTFSQGINLLNGCVAVNGTCVGGGGGSGTINSGTINMLSYYSGATTLDSANYLSIDTSNQRLGIGTTTPAERFSIEGGNIYHTASGTVSVIGGIDITGTVEESFVQGKYLYLVGSAADSNNFRIYDISEPRNPSLISSTALGTDQYGFDVYVVGKYAYLSTDVASAGTCSGSTIDACEFKIYDISNPSSPVGVGGIDVGFNSYELEVSGKYVYIITTAGASGNEIQIYDISDPANPSVVSGIDISSDSTQPLTIHISSNYLYLGKNNGGTDTDDLIIYDISNPVNPSKVGGLEVGTNVQSIHISGKYAYIGTFTKSGTCSGTDLTGCEFRIYDISNPSSITAIGGAEIGTGVYGLTVAGNYVYVGKSSGGSVTNDFIIYDISDNSNPIEVGGLDLSASTLASRINISGKYVYLSNVSSGDDVQIIDISGIHAPAATIGSISSNNIDVSENVFVGNQLLVKGGVNIGTGGIFSNGPISVGVASSTQTGATSAYFEGRVGIGTTTPGATLNVIGSLCVDDSTPTCGDSARTDGTIYAVNTLSATLDLAESYPTKDASLEAGDVVVFDTDNSVYVKKSEDNSQDLLVGVVSTKPGFWLGGFDRGDYADDVKLPIALSGRVPVKATLENGDINIGDPLTASSEAGKAMKATESGKILGYALEEFTSTTNNASSTVLLFVDLGYWQNPNEASATSETNSLLAQTIDLMKDWLESMKVFIQDGLVTLQDLVADKVTTNELEIRDKVTGELYCITVVNGELQNVLGECSALESINDILPSADTNEDTEAPTITLKGFNPTEVEKGISWTDPGVTVTDNIDENLGVRYQVDGVDTDNEGIQPPQIDTNIVGAYTITYTATDSAGNVGTAERVVSVVLPESDTETEDLTPEEPVTDPVVEEPTPTEEPQPETTETDTSTSTE